MYAKNPSMKNIPNTNSNISYKLDLNEPNLTVGDCKWFSSGCRNTYSIYHKARSKGFSGLSRNNFDTA